MTTTTDRCVVITGGGGALGSAVARHLVRGGASVALLDAAHGAERARSLAAELGRAIAIDADVASAASWSDALARIEKDLAPGGVTGATLIAGGWQGGKALFEEDDATWRAMVSANLETAHASLRALLPGMVARRAGSVVVVGSRAVERPWTSATASAYAATKSAVVAMAQAAAAEVVDRGVRINAILPSTLDTPMNRKAMPGVDPATWVSLDSASAVIAFLLSDDARDVSGAAIPLYGRA